MIRRPALLLGIALALPCLAARGQSAELSAKELASALGKAAQDGESVARVRFKIQPEAGGEAKVLQLQIKSRRAPAASAAVYSILWPADRKNEAVLLKQARGAAASGVRFVPPDTETRIDAAAMSQPIFASDLAYQDVIENFFLWADQALAGREHLGKVDCVILDSKPGAGDVSPYGRVRSWIDVRRMVALRVEKFDKQGRPACRIDTTQVAKDDIGRNVPAAMTVRRTGSGSVTEVEGSNIRHDAKLSEADFTPQGLRAAGAR